MKLEQVVESIRRCGELDELWYLASPYTDYPGGIDKAAADVTKVAGALMSRGLIVFAPIVHGHAVDSTCKLGKGHSFWMRQCKQPFLRSHGLIVAQLPGWKESRGIDMEVGWAAEHDMPLFMLDCDDII